MTVIKLKDLSSAVTFASGDVKKLLKLLLERAKVKGNDAKEILKEIINLLAKIKWPNIRDVNFASIIIALYYYFLKSENATLKNIGKKASTTTKNSVLTALKKGDGAKLAVLLKNDFNYKTRKEILNIICGTNNAIIKTTTTILRDYPNFTDSTEDLKKENQVWEGKINNTLEELIARAKKVTKWKINQGLIDDYVELLNDRIKNKVKKDEKADLEKENEDLKKENEKFYEALAKRKLRQQRQRTDYADITDLANIRELERELYPEMEFNEKLVRAKRQVKRMFSPHKSMSRLRDNIPDWLLDILKDDRTKDTEELKRSQEEIARKLNAKKFKSDPRVSENKDKLEKIRKQLGKVKNTMDDFHLNTAKTSDKTNNKNRRKTMDATTFAPKSFTAPTKDDLKKARESLKSLELQQFAKETFSKPSVVKLTDIQNKLNKKLTINQNLAKNLAKILTNDTTIQNNIEKSVLIYLVEVKKQAQYRIDLNESLRTDFTNYLKTYLYPNRYTISKNKANVTFSTNLLQKTTDFLTKKGYNVIVNE